MGRRSVSHFARAAGAEIGERLFGEPVKPARFGVPLTPSFPQQSSPPEMAGTTSHRVEDPKDLTRADSTYKLYVDKSNFERRCAEDSSIFARGPEDGFEVPFGANWSAPVGSRPPRR